MELVKVTKENLGMEHICCAISNDKDVQVVSKKNWLKDRFDEGLVFLKGDVRGKCFIEYLPAEYAWSPIDAKGYMYIDCLWVSGQFKGHGYSNLLLEECIRDSKEKGKMGLVILSSKKKMGFLADQKYLLYKGFQTIDTAAPYFELMYLPFEKDAERPQFKENMKQLSVVGCKNEKRVSVSDNANLKLLPTEHGFTIFYTNQCPFTAKYVPILEGIAKTNQAELKTVHLQTREEAQNAPCPFTTFSVFFDGNFVTHEILSEKKFADLIEKTRQG